MLSTCVTPTDSLSCRVHGSLRQGLGRWIGREASERSEEFMEGNNLEQVSMVTSFILKNQIDQRLLINVIDACVSRLLSVCREEVCAV